MIQITLPDGSQREFPGPVSVAEVAASIGPGLAKTALAGKVDGKLVDTSDLIDHDATLPIITPRTPRPGDHPPLDGPPAGHAVKQLYPDGAG